MNGTISPELTIMKCMTSFSYGAATNVVTTSIVGIEIVFAVTLADTVAAQNQKEKMSVVDIDRNDVKELFLLYS